MKLYEYEVKNVFRDYGIPVPAGKVASSPEEAYKIAQELNTPVAIKAQVLVGGRGKAGGIKFAETPEEAKQVAEEILGKKIKGYEVKSVLVEQKININKELYLGITVDRSAKKTIILASSEGGVDIEEVSRENPEAVKSKLVNIFMGAQNYQSFDLGLQIGLDPSLARQLSSIGLKLYNIFRKFDAELVEINPLIITQNGELIAGDAKMTIYDNALFRQEFEVRPDEFDNEREYEAAKYGLSYVELDGNIGIYATGAGLAMTVMDAVYACGGKPANFCESGGATYRMAAKALDIILSNENVEVLLLVLFGLVSRSDVICEAIAPAIAERKSQIKKGVVAYISGTGEEIGRKIMMDVAGISSEKSLEDAVRKAVELAR